MFNLVKKNTGISYGTPAWNALLGNNKGDLLKDKSYESYIRNAVKGNPVVAGALNFIIMNVFNTPILLVKQIDDDNVEEIKDHPILDLIKKPNKYQEGKDFWRLHYLYLYASGNALVRKEELGGVATAMIQYQPGTYEVKVNPENLLTSDSLVKYIATATGNIIPYEESHLRKNVDPSDEFGGLGKGYSPLEPIASYITLNNKYVAYNNKVLDNSAKPSGIFSINKEIGNPSFIRAKAELEQMYSGVSSAGKIAVVAAPEGKFSQFEDRSDATWIRGFQMTAQKIATALGLDPGLVGEVAAKTYSNFKEAIKKVYNDLIIPLKEEELDFLNSFIVDGYNKSDKKIGTLKLVVDYKNIEVLQNDFTELIKALNGVTYLTEKQKQEATGYEGDDNRDVYVLPFTAREVNKDGSESLTDNQDDDTDNNEEKKLTVKKLKKKAFNLEVFNRVDTLRKQYVEDLDNKMVDFFTQQGKRIATKLINSEDKSINIITKEAISVEVERLMDEIDWEKETELLNITINSAASEAYLAASKEIAGLFNFSSASIEISANKIRDQILERSIFITETMQRKVSEIIATGLTEGQSIQIVATNIQTFIDEEKIYRATRIANTEIGSAVSDGIFQTYINEEIEEHEWITAGDGNVRDSHADQDGFIVKIGDYFPNGLRYPSEYGGPASEIIDCRCITLPIEKRS